MSHCRSLERALFSFRRIVFERLLKEPFTSQLNVDCANPAFVTTICSVASKTALSLTAGCLKVIIALINEVQQEVM